MALTLQVIFKNMVVGLQQQKKIFHIGMLSDIKITNGVILQWGFITQVPKGSWISFALPLSFPNNFVALIASGLSSDIRVSRGNQRLNFFCVNSESNIEWVGIGY